MKVWKKLLGRRGLNQDLEDELQFHLEMKAQALGQQPDAARRQFGNPRAIQEVLRDMWTFPALESWWRDVRYAVRSLAGAPGFTVVAVLALALGIGANTAIFTIIKGAFTWNLDLDHIDRIVWITAANADAHTFDWATSYPEFRDYRSRVKSMEGLGGYRFSPANVSDGTGLPERLSNVQISFNGFAVAEYKPALGRGFVEADEAPGASAVVVIGHRLWQSRFAGDANIVGKVMSVDVVPRTIIGVMPAGRRFPEETDIWTPIVPSEKREDRNLVMFGRLPEEAKVSRVRAEIATIAAALAAQYPATNKNTGVAIRPMAEITGAYGLRTVFGVLFAAVGFVLLIACADVANMLLARGASRTREMAIRVAIGAGRARIFRQLLIESVVLALAGGVGGWLVAMAGLKLFAVGVAGLDKPSWMTLSLDPLAFAYMAAVSTAAGVISGLAPAWRLVSGTGGMNTFLKDGGHGSVSGRATSRLAGGLVVFQMVLCVVLLTAAGLLIRSADRIYSTPVGVPTSNVLTASLKLPDSKYPRAERAEFHRNAQAQIEAIPGVIAAAAASTPPGAGLEGYQVQLQSESTPKNRSAVIVTPAYFGLFAMKPAAGRLFEGGANEVVVNQSFAAKNWPNETAVGKYLRIADGQEPRPWLMVVGIVPDTLQNLSRGSLERNPLLYLPYQQLPGSRMFLLARTGVPPATLANPLRAAIQKLDPNLPLFRIASLESRLDSARMEVTVFGGICSVFAAIALVLATVGLYSVIAHSVSRRSQEIGLRMAMGGAPRDIVSLVFRQGMRPLLIGVLIGVPLALVAMRGLSSALVGVSPNDPLTFAGVVVVLLGAGVLGCVIPARRATRVDPVVALRCQ